MTRRQILVAALLAGGLPTGAIASKLVHIRAADGWTHREDCAVELASPGLSSHTREKARRFHFEVTEPFLAQERVGRATEAQSEQQARRGPRPSTNDLNEELAFRRRQQ